MAGQIIVDAHAHPVAACLEAYRHCQNYAEMSRVFLEGNYNNNPGDLLRLMDQHRVDRACALGGLHKDLQRQLEAIQFAPDRFIGFFCPVGFDPDDAAKQTEEALKRPEFVGVGELYLYQFGGSDWPDMFARLRPVLEVANEARVPVTFHTGNAPYTYHRLAYNDPVYVDEIAREFPELPIIIAHMGCSGSMFFGSYAEHALMVAAKNPNVYLDTSTAPPPVIELAVLEPSIGPSKLLFATDFPAPISYYVAHGQLRPTYRKAPLMEYPRTYQTSLSWIRSLPISDTDKDAILGGNILRILAGVRK